MYPARIREKAIELRKQGYSISELVDNLGITRGTASNWVRGVSLGLDAQHRLQNRTRSGWDNFAKYRITKNKERFLRLQQVIKPLKNFIGTVEANTNFLKCLCSFLFWAEGAKSLSVLHFSNSDPQMVRLFLTLLRKAYPIDETKFRVVMHLHEYHKELRSLRFWANVTNIPKEQFNKTYIKPHTGINKRSGYKGCVRIAYYDSEVAHELKCIYNSLAKYIV